MQPDRPSHPPSRTIVEPAREIPVRYDADLLVCGGGTAGVAAAVCAARLGLSVVMSEMSASPGGMAKTHSWLNDFQNKGGFPREWLEEIDSRGAYERPNYNRFEVVPMLDRKIAEAGVRPLYLSSVVTPLLEGNRVTGAILENKSGRMAVTARIVIDATGDGDVAARAGAEFAFGREEDGATQAMTLAALILNWNGQRMSSDVLADIVRRATDRAGVAYELPYEKWNPRPLVGVPTLSTMGIAHVSGHSGIDAESLSDALIELRRQTVELVELLGRHSDEFAGVRIGPFGDLPGVRESRRIVTDRIITKADAIEGARFDDGLFFVSQNIDIHRPKAGEPGIVVAKVKPYHLPYGALLPRGLENLLVVGRCIGGDHEAAGSYRIMADCMAMGEAAALAAHRAIQTGAAPRQVDKAYLRGEMAARGYEN